MRIFSAGQKPTNIVERKRLCELLADGTSVEFIRTEVINPDTGAIVSTTDTALDGTAYVVVDEENVSECPPPIVVEKTVGRERLSLDDTAAGSLTAPAAADFAYITAVGCGYASDEGTAVLNDGTIGHQVATGASFQVCDDDFADFSAIAEAGNTLELEVTYKQCVVKADD